VVRHSRRARLRYAFDNFMARGTVALVIGLFVASALLIVGVAMLVIVLGGLNDEATAGIDPLQLVWMGLLRTLDPGTMGGDTGTVVFIVGMFSATLGGLFLVAILIGLVTSGIEGKLSELRKGRSRVIEADHSVILGWSAQVFTLIEQLVEANASKRNQRIVVLADRDKVAMEDEIRLRVPDTRTTRVVCRSGSPIDPADIDICSPQSARSIIVLSNGEDGADAEVIKTLLALTSSASRRQAHHNIVAVLDDPGNVPVARLAVRGEAHILIGGDLIARIAAQACRQSGLAVVYEELLDFTGQEMYVAPRLDLAGRSFGEALLAFRDAALMGVMPAGGRAQLNPPMDTVIAETDRLIVMAEDDSAIRTAERPTGLPVLERIAPTRAAPPGPERTLMLGWSRRAAQMLVQLDRYVAAGSAVTAVSIAADAEPAGQLATTLANTTLTFRAGDTTSRQLLEALVAEGYDHAVIMAASDTLDQQRADSRSLVTLLHLRDVIARAGTRLPIVTEMLDVRNRNLAQATSADDFIVSERLVSEMLAQLSESPELDAVFADLFDPAGSEIYLRPATNYVTLDDGAPVDFYTVVEAASRRGEVCIGYRLMAQAGDAARSYGVVLNPDKAELVPLSEGDLIVVLAEA
jgi:voltage-gated potassium channel Kch